MTTNNDDIERYFEGEHGETVVDIIRKLPASWLANMILQHSYLHPDLVAAAAGLDAADWLRTHSPVEKMPEVASCAIAQMMVYYDITDVRELQKLDRQTLHVMVNKAWKEHEETAKKALEKVERVKIDMMAKGEIQLVPENWDKNVH